MNRRQFLTAIGLGPLAPHLDKLAGMLPGNKETESASTIRMVLDNNNVTSRITGLRITGQWSSTDHIQTRMFVETTNGTFREVPPEWWPFHSLPTKEMLDDANYAGWELPAE